MGTKHTPGPWYAIGDISKRQEPIGYRPVIVNETAYEQCELGAVSVEKLERIPAKYIADLRGPGRNWKIPSEETAANAKLIAAAPELLEALTELVASVRGKGPRDGKTLSRADAAIARATSPT